MDKQPPTVLHVWLVVTAYVVVSVGMVYINRWLFSTSFQYPVFVSFAQQVWGFILYLLLSKLSLIADAKKYKLQLRLLVKVIPLSVCFVLWIGMSNFCLQQVQISTYQIARSLTIVFVMGLSVLVLKESFSKQVMAACAIQVSGFILGSFDPSTLNLLGVLSGGASSLFQALYNVLVKYMLTQYFDDDTGVLLYHNFAVSAVLFIPMIAIFGEGEAIGLLPTRYDTIQFYVVWSGLLVSCTCSVLFNLISYACISFTSPLTFNIIGITKSVAQTGGSILLGDRVTAESIGGIILTLCGSVVYSHAKLKEKRPTAPRLVPYSPITRKESNSTMEYEIDSRTLKTTTDEMEAV